MPYRAVKLEHINFEIDKRPEKVSGWYLRTTLALRAGLFSLRKTLLCFQHTAIRPVIALAAPHAFD